MKTKAAVCRAFGEPLAIEDIDLAPVGPGEVRVKIAACAICHSDIHYVEGAWGGELPAVYGHEAAGIVEEVGAGVAPSKARRSCGRDADPLLRPLPCLCAGRAGLLRGGVSARPEEPADATKAASRSSMACAPAPSPNMSWSTLRRPWRSRKDMPLRQRLADRLRRADRRRRGGQHRRRHGRQQRRRDRQRRRRPQQRPGRAARRLRRTIIAVDLSDAKLEAARTLRRDPWRQSARRGSRRAASSEITGGPQGRLCLRHRRRQDRRSNRPSA